MAYRMRGRLIDERQDRSSCSGRRTGKSIKAATVPAASTGRPGWYPSSLNWSAQLSVDMRLVWCDLFCAIPMMRAGRCRVALKKDEKSSPKANGLWYIDDLLFACYLHWWWSIIASWPKSFSIYSRFLRKRRCLGWLPGSNWVLAEENALSNVHDGDRKRFSG